ncbi:NADPH-dependent oxidoreductase [Aerococcus agrisoli]|uniref:NADPH-dependent oxidoreductase n=1 Tax=Aerococcus agrisoli TaxID=2487350 RepID=A0A3N4GHR4_9LACT|nr:NAD(P)H-dependent oxidoreductase [Aerococcus agrisoli]RPA60967.1 NADPH-dependent oxidoreductase [Aerococcus agrisoli]
MVKISGIVGSVNEHSVSRKVLQKTEKYFSDEVTLEEIEYTQVPLFSVNNEYPAPDAVVKVREAIKESDGLIFIVPEYNLSFSGVLKNLIDWISRPEIMGDPKPILDKPILVISTSAGISGGMVAQEEVRSILNYLGASLLSQPRVSFANVYSLLDERQHLTLDPASAGYLKDTVEAFEQFVNHFHTK